MLYPNIFNELNEMQMGGEESTLELVIKNNPTTMEDDSRKTQSLFALEKQQVIAEGGIAKVVVKTIAEYGATIDNNKDDLADQSKHANQVQVAEIFIDSENAAFGRGIDGAQKLDSACHFRSSDPLLSNCIRSTGIGSAIDGPLFSVSVNANDSLMLGLSTSADDIGAEYSGGLVYNVKGIGYDADIHFTYQPDGNLANAETSVAVNGTIDLNENAMGQMMGINLPTIHCGLEWDQVSKENFSRTDAFLGLSGVIGPLRADAAVYTEKRGAEGSAGWKSHINLGLGDVSENDKITIDLGLTKIPKVGSVSNESELLACLTTRFHF